MHPFPPAPLRARSAVLVLALAGAAACRGPATQAPQPARQAAEAAARQAIAGERAISADTFPAASVGVGPFAVASSDTAAEPLAYGLADLLLNDLARSAQLQVVDRVRIQALLGELQLTSAGAVDPATAPRVGRLMGARRLVVGSIASAGRDLRIDTRVADVPGARVTASVDATAPLERILDAEKTIAFRLFDALGVTLTPQERANVEQRPTRNIAALLAYGRAVRYETLGNYDAAAREYAEALRLDPGFALAGTRAAALGGGRAASASPTRGPARRAAELAAGEINRSFAEDYAVRGDRASDPAFLRAQTATLVLIVRVIP